MYSSKNSILVLRVHVEMSVWQEWSRLHRPESLIESRDEELFLSRDHITSHKDQFDIRQFLTWEDLIGQR